MIRVYHCLICLSDDSPQCFANDAWCSDRCHKVLAEHAGVKQFEVTVEVINDVLDFATKETTWDQFYEEIKARVHCNRIANNYGNASTGHEIYLQGRGTRPDDRSWHGLRRVNAGDHGVQEPAESRTEAEDGVLR